MPRDWQKDIQVSSFLANYQVCFWTARWSINFLFSLDQTGCKKEPTVVSDPLNYDIDHPAYLPNKQFKGLEERNTGMSLDFMYLIWTGCSPDVSLCWPKTILGYLPLSLRNWTFPGRGAKPKVRFSLSTLTTPVRFQIKVRNFFQRTKCTSTIALEANL